MNLQHLMGLNLSCVVMRRCHAMLIIDESEIMLRIKNCMPVADEGFILRSPVELTLRQGEVLWLKGVNGSGKSCLLNAIAGRMRHEGLVMYDGCILQMSQREQYICTGRIELSLFSHYRVSDFTAYYFEIFGLTNIEVPELLQKIYDLKIGQLSSGQAQLLKFFFVTITGKRIWLLDEFDSHLDSHNKDYFYGRCLSFAAAGGAILVTSHQDIGGFVTDCFNLE